jgi:WS/DGAT/MGAT family acyltransferase
MELIARVRERHDVTMNDVVLAACSGALRRFLIDHDDDVEARTMKAMVPVSIRSADEHGDTLGNRISLIIVDLPIDEPDPLIRLERLHHSMSERKQDTGLMDGTQRIVELADVIPALAVPLTKFVSRSIPMNLAITNIPGPPIPLFLQGARVLRTYPYVEVIDNEGLTIAVVSYDDQLFFGLTSDRDVLPDLADLAVGIEGELHELAEAEAAQRTQRDPGRE